LIECVKQSIEFVNDSCLYKVGAHFETYMKNILKNFWTRELCDFEREKSAYSTLWSISFWNSYIKNWIQSDSGAL